MAKRSVTRVDEEWVSIKFLSTPPVQEVMHWRDAEDLAMKILQLTEDIRQSTKEAS